jgi:hypothetical protein
MITIIKKSKIMSIYNLFQDSNPLRHTFIHLLTSITNERLELTLLSNLFFPITQILLHTMGQKFKFQTKLFFLKIGFLSLI